MYQLPEEQRKQLLQYMWTRPYGEVHQMIAILASLQPVMDKKDEPTKKDMS